MRLPRSGGQLRITNHESPCGIVVPIMELRICHLYPDLLNLYGDRGNLMALVHRAQWRGIDVHVEESRLGVSPAPGAHDLYFMGGGGLWSQVLGRTVKIGLKERSAATCMGPTCMARCCRRILP